MFQNHFNFGFLTVLRPQFSPNFLPEYSQFFPRLNRMTKSRFICIECDTNHMATKPPSEPKFHKTVMYPNGDRARIKVTWQPDIKGNPGSHFYVQYRKSGEIHFRSTNEELNEDSVVVDDLEFDQFYDFRVVAVDGRFETPSQIQDVYTYSTLPQTGMI